MPATRHFIVVILYHPDGKRPNLQQGPSDAFHLRLSDLAIESEQMAATTAKEPSQRYNGRKWQKYGGSMLTTSSIVGIFLAAIINMVIGFIWYSDVAFGKVWRKLVGMSEKDFEERRPEMPKILGLTFGAALVTGYILTVFAQKMGMQGNPIAGVIMGFWAGVGLVLATTLHDYLFTRKPLPLFWISMGYEAFAVMVMGGIVAWFA